MKSQFKIMIAATIGILCLLVMNGILYERNLYDSVQKITDLTAVSLKSELDKQIEITRRASADMASDYTLNRFLDRVAAGVNDDHEQRTHSEKIN